MQRKNYLVSKVFRTFLIASLLSSVTQQICALADSIILSNFVAPEALSALNFTIPVTSLLFCIVPLFCTGAGMVVAKAIGAQDYLQANRLYTVAIGSTTGLMLCVSMMMMLFYRELASFLCDDGAILPYLLSYFKVYLWGTVVGTLFMCLSMFVSIEGKPALVTKAAIVSSVSNVLLDLLFVVGMGWSIEGAVLSTILSQLLGVLLLLSHLLGRSSTYRLVNVLGHFGRTLKINVKQGIPFVAGSLTSSFTFYFINQIVFDAQGTTGSFIIAVCLQVWMFSYLGVAGAGAAILSVGGVMCGEKDMVALRLLVFKSLRFMVLVVGMLTLYILLFPRTLIRLFGADDIDLQEACVWPLRLFALGLLPMGTGVIIRYTHQLQGYLTACTLFGTLQMLLLVPILWVCASLFPDYMWLAFPIGFTLVLLMQCVWARLQAAKSPSVGALTLIPTDEKGLHLDISVSYNEKEVGEALREAELFLMKHHVDQIKINNIILCCEELMCNLVAHANQAKVNQTFDLHLQLNDQKVCLILKDDGSPFNPIFKYVPPTRKQLLAGEGVNIGLTLVNALCAEINYKFMYGQNMLYLNFAKVLGEK